METNNNKNENENDVKTTEKYWDCECPKNYIHPKSQNACKICGTNADEQPDSRINEVIKAGLPI